MSGLADTYYDGGIDRCSIPADEQAEIEADERRERRAADLRETLQCIVQAQGTFIGSRLVRDLGDYQIEAAEADVRQAARVLAKLVGAANA
jgi:hypothetical protein